MVTAQSVINRAACSVLESVPGKLGGAWVSRGTRVPYTTVLNNIGDITVRELADSFPTVRCDQIIVFLESLARSAAPTIRKPKRILLDENVSHMLMLLFTGHTVVSSSYQGWAGKSNGDLVALAETGGFKVMLPADQNLGHQENMKKRTLALLVLSSNRTKTVLAHSSRILAAIDATQPGSYTFVSLA